MTTEERILRIEDEREWWTLQEMIREAEKHLGKWSTELSWKIHNNAFLDLERAPPKDWLPICASAIDIADVCAACPYRSGCKKLSHEMDKAAGISDKQEGDDKG